jgi:hypothetical protein
MHFVMISGKRGILYVLGEIFVSGAGFLITSLE